MGNKLKNNSTAMEELETRIYGEEIKVRIELKSDFKFGKK